MEPTEGALPLLASSKSMNDAKLRNWKEQKRLMSKLAQLNDDCETATVQITAEQKLIELELHNMKPPKRGNRGIVCPPGMSSQQKEAFKAVQKGHLPTITLEQFDRRLKNYRLKRYYTKEWYRKIQSTGDIPQALKNEDRTQSLPVLYNSSDSHKQTTIPTFNVNVEEPPSTTFITQSYPSVVNERPHGLTVPVVQIPEGNKDNKPIPHALRIRRAITMQHGFSLADQYRNVKSRLRVTGKFGMPVGIKPVLDMAPSPEPELIRKPSLKYQGKSISLPDIVHKVDGIVQSWNDFKALTPFTKVNEVASNKKDRKPSLLKPPLPGTVWANFNVFNRTLQTLTKDT